MIKIFFVGNLGADAELRTAGDNGQSVLNFRVAAHAGKDDTVWVRCAMWGKRGESIAQYLKKGTKVVVSGGMTMSEWTKDGKTQQQVECRVDDVDFSGPAKKNPFGGDT